MKFNLVALLALPCIASAVTLTKVGTVPTSGGSAIAIADGVRLHDGTWVVGDSTNAFWGSVDQGKSWTPVPTLPGDTIAVLGDALTSHQTYGIWTPAKGWHDMSFPASWMKIVTAGDYFTYMGSDGLAAIQVNVDSDIQYCRSVDGFETWQDFLTVSYADVPAGADPIGNLALGKIWYVVADSGYARGTADGRSWTRVSLPTSFTTYFLTSENADTILTAIGADADGNTSGGYSLDRGKTWTERSTSEPGAAIVMAKNGYFVSITGDQMMGALDVPAWISRDLTNWEPIGKAVDVLFEGAQPYAIKADGIYRIDAVAGSTGISRGVNGADALLKLERGVRAMSVQLDASLLGKPWQLVGADGSVRARGTVASTSLELPALRGAGWLKVGGATLAIPGL